MTVVAVVVCATAGVACAGSSGTGSGHTGTSDAARNVTAADTPGPAGATTGTTTSAATTSPATTGAATTGTTGGADTGQPATPARCATPGLTLSTVAPAGGSAMGHHGLVLVFRNTTKSPCALTGYPGVAASGTNGQHAADATRSSVGSIFPQTPRSQVVLAPDGTASAGLEWTVVPMGTQGSCPDYIGLTVTPPGETRSLQLARALSFCGEFQIHPLVAGADAGGIAQ
ncbi:MULTISPECIES: DUF4232 domain-containing protein [unclassified Frankia]|uniref:DUF4232 domain-containing protein n=1 Tax=unclassified Frankia TaxID=2632575 RepID=UPI002AD53C51|nr:MULTISPECIES: DUF4232 domain-containing protein [unclassified Frankia]